MCSAEILMAALQQPMHVQLGNADISLQETAGVLRIATFSFGSFSGRKPSHKRCQNLFS
jgi:hypothetical protein